MKIFGVLKSMSGCLVVLFVVSLQLSVSFSQLFEYDIDSNCSLLSRSGNEGVTCDAEYANCDIEGYLNISTEYYSYYGANTTIDISVNTTEQSLRYYKVCTQMGDSDDYVLVGCLANNATQFNASMFLNETGLNVLTVTVYNDTSFNQSSFLDCTTSKILIAANGGFDLDVRLLQTSVEEYVPIVPATIAPNASAHTPSTIVPSSPAGLSCPTEPIITRFQIGNITFMAGINLTNYSTAIFTYSFGDGNFRTDNVNQTSNTSQVAHHYTDTGDYYYSVHAIVVLQDDELALHMYDQSNITVYERVTEPTIQVGPSGTSVATGVVTVKVSIPGSLPVKFCWCIVFPNSTYCSKVPIVNSTATTNISCVTVYNSTDLPYTVLMNFTMDGRHHIRANFSNIINCRNKSFPFSVVSPTPPVVIITISSATIGVLAALSAVIVIIIIVITVYIPYRRYKNRMTETANFRFVELSESSNTVKGKVKRKARSFASYFRFKKQSDRVGLVNTDIPDEDELGSSERLLNRGNKNVVPFPAYDSL